MVVGESKRTNIMDGIENTGDVRLHDHRLRLKQRFDIVRKLGQGTYGKVQLGINKKTGQEVAIKTIKKCKIETEADLVRIRREVQIMSSVRHPNIVHIYEVFENSEKMILVMEYCSGGELYDYLSQKKVLEEDEARRLFRQIATAVYYCHIHKICHRDLKLENVLLDDTGSAKIADFGLSNVFKETSLLSTFCGSPLYASPEIVKGTPYIGPEVDCWSLGVLLYTLVYGAMPFDGSNFKRLVRQISNGDYYEPKNPSSASPLIRDMLTVDPLKRADIAYICDNPWVNMGCETSCLEVAEALAAETPVRLDLLLSLAPAASSHSNSVMVPAQTDLGPEESCTDLTSSTSMAVEPSNSAEKRILDLVAEGGEDAIKPSPTRTIVAADNKRKLEAAMSASGLSRKKERVPSCASVAPLSPALPEEEAKLDSPPVGQSGEMMTQPILQSSATMVISPAPATEPVREVVEKVKGAPREDDQKETTKQRAVVRKTSPTETEDKLPGKQEAVQAEESKPRVAANAADKLTSLALVSPAPPAPAAPPTPPGAPATPTKPKKLSIPGGHVGSFKEQFERRASLTTSPEIKRNISKPVVSKIAKPKAQSEDRDLSSKSPDNGTVRLQQIGIEPSLSPVEDNRGGVKKTESEPANSSTPVDPTVLLQDARRSLQNSMAKLAEERAGEDTRRRAARDIISSAIRTGKPPVPYGRSSSAGVATAALQSPSAPATPATPSSPSAGSAPRLFRTEAHHKVEDHRNRGVSVERIIPIHVAGEEPQSPPVKPAPSAAPAPPSTPAPAPAPPAATARVTHTPLRRLTSTESSGASEACSSPGEPIKKSAREFIIPIAVEGKGYVTPRQRSLEPEAHAAHAPHATHTARRKPRRISSLVSGGSSEEEDDAHMHRLRSTRAARADSVSSGEDDEEDEGFHLLTAENLFHTLLHRVRSLTQRLNGEEGPGFQHPHSLFNNLQSPFFNSPHLPRRNLFSHTYMDSKRSVSETRDGWGARDLHAPFDSMFNKARPQMPRGSNKGKHQTRTDHTEEAKGDAPELSDLELSGIELSERELAALSGLTPALARRLQRSLLAHLPPAAARRLRRTLSRSLSHTPAAPDESEGDSKLLEDISNRPDEQPEVLTESDIQPHAQKEPEALSEVPNAINNQPHVTKEPELQSRVPSETIKSPVEDDVADLPASQFCTLPRFKRRSPLNIESPTTPPDTCSEFSPRLDTLMKETNNSRNNSIRSTPDRPLLSKYLSSERNAALDEYSSDGGSILSEPSYIAAYGSSLVGSNPSLGFRRHSLRLTGDQPRKRISRFLRSDFFDTPSDDSLYIKHKKEKELETQKILKEIREKRNKSQDSSFSKSPSEVKDEPLYKDENSSVRKCLSPIGNILGRDRSRSTTPFFPILDNIKETTLDTSLKTANNKINKECSSDVKNLNSNNFNNAETKLTRPKSYPIKNVETYEDSNKTLVPDKTTLCVDKEEARKLSGETKLVRPKSYPSSSSSPDKKCLNRNMKKDDTKNNMSTKTSTTPENKSDVEVSFSFTLPKKTKHIVSKDTSSAVVSQEQVLEKENENLSTLSLRKYQVINDNAKDELKENQLSDSNSETKSSGIMEKSSNIQQNNKDEGVSKTVTSENSDQKGTIKKKIIKKVSSKSKIDLANKQVPNDSKTCVEKKKVTKKVKEKSVEKDINPSTVTKKKSVLQSIGQKLEKFATSKSISPEKSSNNLTTNGQKKGSIKIGRTQRENSVPTNIDPPTESNLIKRAVTLTDVAALDNQTTPQNKTTVSKVLGLFKKFEPRDKTPRQSVDRSLSENNETTSDSISKNESSIDDGKEKLKRPTSLLLNGLGRKNKNSKVCNNVVSEVSTDSDQLIKKDNDVKNLRNTLKLDFSKLPRVKKVVPTNSVIEPKIMNFAVDENKICQNDLTKKNLTLIEECANATADGPRSRSRSRSQSTYSSSEVKCDINADSKDKQHSLPDPSFYNNHLPIRHHDSTTPEKEDLAERIRRKSFYSRFNEKKQRRKSNLVGPGATDYDPVARIYSQATDHKYDVSPTSPGNYDLSPGYSIASDLSPSMEHYKSLVNDLPASTRSNSRYDGLCDKYDTYRSLDRNDFRKYSGSRSYLDYDQASIYSPHRYSRTKSLFDSSDSTEDQNPILQREPHKYNRTNSMYSPGNYATYRPKRTRNPAIILKESEKEPSPENILDKIRQRKISISVTRKSDPDKDTLSRSTGPPKGESDRTERSEKVD